MREFYRNLGKLRWLVWVALGVLVLSIGLTAGALGVKTETPVEAPAEVNESAPEIVEDTSAVDANAICELLCSTMEGHHDFCDVYYDEELNTIMVNIANEGVQAGACEVKKGYFQSEWREVRSSMESLSETICELCRLQGFEGDVAVSLLNDEELGKVILLLLNGEIVYDFTE